MIDSPRCERLECPRSQDLTWVSGHLYVAARCERDLDRAIVSVVRPFVLEAVAKKLVTSHFIVRYAESGLHIRVRLLTDIHVQKVVEAAFLQCVSQQHGSSVSPESQAEAGDLSSHHAVFWVPYEPEISRYGEIG